MNTRMLKDPMLYMGSIVSSFLFGFIESFLGIFNFALTVREVSIIVLLSVVGIFFSVFFYGLLSDAEHDFELDIRRNTIKMMKAQGYRKAPLKHKGRR